MTPPEYQRPTERGRRGLAVKHVQEWLCLHHCATAIDGDFGPATERAVRRFQCSQGIELTGAVDRETHDALWAPMRAAVAESPASNRSLAECVIACARQHLKQHPREVGGDNRGPWVRLYMDGHEGAHWFWCAGFVSFILKQAAKTAGVPVPVKKTYSCDVLAVSGKDEGRFVSEYDMRDGAAMAPGAVFLVRRKAFDWTHTGIVTAFHGDSFDTIEGNTNDDGHRNGYEVCARTRDYRNKDFIRI